MKKGLVVLLLASAMMLTSCGSTEEQSASAASSDTESAELVETEEESSDNASENEEEEESEEEIEKVAITPFFGTGTIEDTVIVDEKDVKITASNLSYDNYEATMDLLIENNSDEDLSFYSGTLGYNCNAVNGYTISSIYLYQDVSAGATENCSVSISNTEMELMGITDIAELEIGFQIETDDYDEYLATGPIKIQTSAAESYDLSEDTYQKIVENGSFASLSEKKITKFQTGDLFSSNGVNLISAALAEDSEGNSLILELENTTDQFLYFVVGDIAVNDLVISDGNWDSVGVNPGGRGLLVINIEDVIEYGDKEVSDIDDISNVDFYVAIGSADGRYLVKDEKASIDLDAKKDNQKKSETKETKEAKETKETKKEEAAESASKDSDLVDGMHPEFKEAMDSYEEFMNEYCEFMQKYADSDKADVSMLAEYTEYVGKYAEVVDSFEAWDEEEMNDTEIAYYLDVQTRVSKKLLEVEQ